ncbi:hypothetical protein B5M47_02610 [candidate division CPR3 bacterium 4484_211]|uniref:UBA domain-containing protein n=1 Tax=candidate division CPR3 bacterium 4484_211 TaxID=1968527 RepID=A0A1W9NY42_UNCC3|nr:MAG: hypothetical protein B5M47_02610 [candidate division CPR3 bacterium 4484_211]
MKVSDNFSTHSVFRLFDFPWWWYVRNMNFWARFLPRTFLSFVDMFSFTEILRVFFRPYRRDYTWVGYLIGILFRTFWLLVTGLILVALFALLASVFLLYLFTPLIILSLLINVRYRLWGIGGLSFLYFVYYAGAGQGAICRLSEADTFDQLRQTFLPQTSKFYKRVGNKKYSPVLFFQEILAQPMMKQYVVRLGLSKREKLSQITDEVRKVQGEVASWKEIFEEAREIGLRLGRNHLSCELLFLAWVKLERDVERVFEKQDLEWRHLKEASQWMYAWQLRKESWKYWQDRFFHRRGGVDVGWVAGWIPYLKHFSTNITDLVKRGRLPYLIGRDEILNQIMGILQRTTRNNVLLVGLPGVGKTTIAYGIAERILLGKSRGKLSGKKVIRLDLAGLLAGTAGRGVMEERVRAALNEIRGGESILFIDEIHALIGAGGQAGATDVASFLAPTLSTGSIQVIATTTPEDYRRYIESNPTFASYFQVVRVEEPSAEECLRILQWFVPQMEADQGVKITFPALDAAVKLTQRYIHDRYLPGKAVELLDESAVSVRRRGKKVVEAEDVALVLSEQTRIPLEQLTAKEQNKLLRMEEILHQRIVDQEEAVCMVSNALRRARSGLTSGARPIASFLFVGPTGVGKTETAKALSAAYFGSERNMIRVDMSEYAQPEQINRLIGPPPGYPGYEEGGFLTEAVRSRPFAVVLMDEIEKAHTKIHNLLLQLLDEGRLTDGKGRTIDFTNTMIICTSNAYSVLIQESLREGLNIEKIQEQLLNNLQKVFRPELLNRFDGVIVFKPLNRQHMVQIARLMLNEVVKRMREQKVELSFDEETISKLAELGFDPQFGARPLQRVIQNRVKDKLAKMLLAGELEKGSAYTFTLRDLLD